MASLLLSAPALTPKTGATKSLARSSFSIPELENQYATFLASAIASWMSLSVPTGHESLPPLARISRKQERSKSGTPLPGKNYSPSPIPIAPSVWPSATIARVLPPPVVGSALREIPSCFGIPEPVNKLSASPFRPPHTALPSTALELISPPLQRTASGSGVQAPAQCLLPSPQCQPLSARDKKSFPLARPILQPTSPISLGHRDQHS